MNSKKLTAIAAGLLMAGSIGCKDLETGMDPNRPTVAAPKLLFVGVQTAIASFYGSDLSRIAAMFTQQAFGASSQYISTYEYTITEGTTNGQHVGFYITGGLGDVRKLQAQVAEVEDANFLGVAQVQEALMMSLAADVFGDLVYREALQGGDPQLDPQMQVYQDLVDLLDVAIGNLQNTTSPGNAGPGTSDLVYGSYPLPVQMAKWTALAYTLKARIHMNMAEVAPANYELARLAALNGIMDPADDYVAVYSGASGEENLLHQFVVNERPNQLRVNDNFAAIAAGNPRLTEFARQVPGTGTPPGPPTWDFATAFVTATAPQKIVTADENILILAETEWRRSNFPAALDYLNEYQALHGITESAGLTGDPLLTQILTEKYIALFMQVQAWSDYKRTCFPNLVPVTSGMIIPARLFYDSNERSTNPNMPTPNQQPERNENDPPNATADGVGGVCLGQ